jgi:hypothetical protein
MATRRIPIIRREDYEAFCNVPTRGLPMTFAEWELKTRESEARNIGGGHDVEPVVVNLAEFLEYCRTAQQQPSCDSLELFVNR